MRRRAWIKLAIGSTLTPLAAYSAWRWRDEFVEKRFAVVVPGLILRGAWQRPGPLRRIITRERIKTILTLTAINRDDPKYVDQDRVVRKTGVTWRFVPIKGSYATLDQMAEAGAILADPALQPIFFHCVAGHHRSSQVQAAYRIRTQAWTPERAWAEVAALPWADPVADGRDRRLIESFASRKKDAHDGPSTMADPSGPAGLDLGSGGRGGRRLDPADLVEFRRRRPG